jgi:acetolactate synthase-1/2/3 large subunit
MRLRHAAPRDTILVTDVGSIKSVTSQCWSTFSPLTFFESNGLSAMSYGFAGAMAARLLFPDRPVVCTIGDGGFGMTLSEIETCVRRRIHFVTVVYNDNSLSLIRVSQENKGHPNYGVDYSPVNFAAVAEALGAWTRQVRSLDELEEVFRAGLSVDRPVVIDVPIDLREYRAHNAPAVSAVPLQAS